MALNITDELFSKTVKGKLGSATQIFLNGDNETVEQAIKTIREKITETGGNGFVTLDENGKVPASLLPAYVDDVLEGTLVSETEFTLAEELHGEVQLPNVIYIDTTTNKTYRWSGTRYIAISSDIALGETESTAYPGNKGKATTDLLNKWIESSEANSQGFINTISSINNADYVDSPTDKVLKSLNNSGVSYKYAAKGEDSFTDTSATAEVNGGNIPYASTSTAGVVPKEWIASLSSGTVQNKVVKSVTTTDITHQSDTDTTTSYSMKGTVSYNYADLSTGLSTLLTNNINVSIPKLSVEASGELSEDCPDYGLIDKETYKTAASLEVLTTEEINAICV